MKTITSPMEYVEYLLKNYHAIHNDLEQIKIELEHYQVETVDETIEAMSLGAETPLGDSTARVALVYRQVNERLNLENKRRLEKRLLYGEIELRKLNAAISCLPEDTKKVIEDLYIHRLKWDQISMRRYICNNTINRHRKNGIAEIARGFFGGEVA